jgi:hypothetical protein
MPRPVVDQSPPQRIPHENTPMCGCVPCSYHRAQLGKPGISWWPHLVGLALVTSSALITLTVAWLATR